MTKPSFKTVTRTQGNNRALKEGEVVPETFNFEFEEIEILVKGFRRMVRELEFDICEMAITTYICARDHGVKFTALPIFLVRDFHHASITYNVNCGINSPKDLEGKKVGMNGGYTKTGGVWGRSILKDEGDVDLSSVTWVLSGDEHVEAYQAPGNVVSIEEGKTLTGMLESGEIVAGLGVKSDHPDVQPLFPDPFEEAVNSMKTRGLYPINHLVCVRNDLLEANPDLAVDIFNTFAASKKLYVEKLKAGRIEDLTTIDKIHLRALEVMDDPLPYGIEPNRKTLEDLVAHATQQQIIRGTTSVEDLFAKSTHGLVA